MQELKKMEQGYDQQLRKIRVLENWKNKNRRTYRKIEQSVTDFDAVNQELNLMINDMLRHWKGDTFLPSDGILEEEWRMGLKMNTVAVNSQLPDMNRNLDTMIIHMDILRCRFLIISY